MSRVGFQPTRASENDGAVAGEPARQRVRVVVARHEHERLAGANDPADQRGLERAAAVGQVADEEHGPARGRSLEDRQREDVVVQIRGDGQPRAVLERGPVGRGGDEAGEADELRVELLVERPGRPLGRLDRLERARDVRAEGVVLRRVDRAAGREQDDERDGRHEGGGDRRAGRVAQLRRRAAADREGHQHAERAAAQEDGEDDVAQVGRDLVARLLPDRMTSTCPPSATRLTTSRSTVRRSTRRRAGSRIASKRAPQSTSGT